jgi:hypothetical protein
MPSASLPEQPPKASFFRGFFERVCLAGWMLHLVATTVLVGLSVELLIFGGLLSFYNISLLNDQSLEFLLYGGAAALNFPLVFKFRAYGMAHLNFELHEGEIDRMVLPPEFMGNYLLALFDAPALRSQELRAKEEAIDGASSPSDRQDLRREAKLWVLENRSGFSEEDTAFIQTCLGYMISMEDLRKKSSSKPLTRREAQPTIKA